MISFSFCSNCFLLSTRSAKRAYFWLDYRFVRFCTASQGIVSCSYALMSDTIFCTILRGSTWFIFIWHIDRKTCGLFKNTATGKGDLLFLVVSISWHCKRLNFGLLIFNACRRRCTVLVRILIVQFLWTLFIEIIRIVTVLNITWNFFTLERLFLVTYIVCHFNPWTFIWSLLFFFWCLAIADSIQFDLLLDNFIHLLCHLSTLKHSFRRNSWAAVVIQHACNLKCSEKDRIENHMLCLGDVIFKLDELIAE